MLKLEDKYGHHDDGDDDNNDDDGDKDHHPHHRYSTTEWKYFSRIALSIHSGGQFDPLTSEFTCESRYDVRRKINDNKHIAS